MHMAQTKIICGYAIVQEALYGRMRTEFGSERQSKDRLHEKHLLLDNGWRGRPIEPHHPPFALDRAVLLPSAFTRLPAAKGLGGIRPIRERPMMNRCKRRLTLAVQRTFERGLGTAIGSVQNALLGSDSLCTRGQ